ncbi:sentrin-specific protease 8 isoform X1 [Hydra vulgaris]|uniref:sentrin-specific protease 8 isoform X1 n=1 Tax=Hydra vulgaris TaxID=6087 RepID=UPI001F5EB2E3|nr:sentrin-specific protease 8-like [Hydra vulgaris]
MSIISYHNSYLESDDIHLLSNKEWLNDRIISFMFEYFEHEMFNDLSQEIGFVSPEVSQFVKLVKTSEEVAIFLEPLELSKKKLIFFVVNNNESPLASGGTHWSLLVIWNGIFYHYDSAHTFNLRNAEILAHKIFSSIESSASFQFVNVDCPQQSNSYDCGIYVIVYCENLCQSYRRNKSLALTADFDAISQRKKILLIVNSLK